MANFKGKIRTIGDRLYKKDRAIENKPTTIEPIPMECDVYIPNLNQLDLTQFVRAVDPKDNDRVFYCKTVDGENKISILESGTNITFFNGSNMNGKVYSNNRISNGIDASEYVFAPPYSGDGTTSNRFNGLYAFNIYDTLSGPSSSTVNFETMADYIFDVDSNVDVMGLEGYVSDDDSLVMPGTRTTINLETTPGIILCDDEYFPALRGSCKISGISDTVDGKSKYWSAYSQVFGQLYMFGKNGKITANIPVCRIGGTNNNQISPAISSGASNFCIFCLFLDENEEFWIMTLTPDKLGSSIVRVDVTLTKAKNIYTSRTSHSSNVEGQLTSALNYLDESSFGDINKFFHKLVAIDKESGGGDYGEDGPDIIGPGDVYEDILNNSNVQQVGGRPNITDDVEEDTAQPNTGIDQFRVGTGFFGSYELTAENLKQYAGTLSMCYDHANDVARPISSMVGKEAANVIAENTNNVIMLPFDIPDDKSIESPFTVGTFAIAERYQTDYEYAQWIRNPLKNNCAKARLIKQEITEFNIDLGTISHYYDNYLDFPPYSEGNMYIPYIGVVSIPLDMMQSTSEVQKQIELKFRINNTNGDILVLLRVDGMTLNHWTGNCARDIQIKVNDMSNVIREGTQRLVGAIAPALGMFMPGTSHTNITKPFSNVKTVYNPKTFEHDKIVDKGIETTWQQTTTSHAPDAVPSINNLPNLASVNSISSSNPVGGSIGFMDSQDVILSIYRPIVWKPYDYGGLIGFPTKRIAKLSSINGFARVSEMHLKCSATLEEKNEIQSLLSGGVIFDEN